jgi:hypothetical protein
MRLLSSSVALLAMVSSAAAADLTRAPAPLPTVAPLPVFDAYAAVAAGYSWGRNSKFDLDNDGARLQGRGSFSYTFAPTYGFQADAVLGHDWAEFSDIDFKDPTTEATLAAHLFWRDPNVGAIGLLAQYSGLKTRYEFGGSSASLDSDNYLLGLEGQYFFGNASLYGQLAYHYADVGFFGEDGDGVAVVGQLRYFATPDWLLALKGGYDRVKIDEDSDDITAKAWLVGVKTEYRLANAPLSLFGDLTYSNIKYDFSGLDFVKDRETRLMVGVKYNFTAPSLLERDRAGASFDPIELRSRFVFGGRGG